LSEDVLPFVSALNAMRTWSPADRARAQVNDHCSPAATALVTRSVSPPLARTARHEPATAACTHQVTRYNPASGIVMWALLPVCRPSSTSSTSHVMFSKPAAAFNV